MPRLLFIVLLSVAGFAQAGGQVNVWIPRGPEGGRIGRPVIDPQNPGTIYASAGGRLYQTTDAAGHWNDLGVPSVTILAVDPRNSSTLYGANNNTLYKSTDGGLTWSKPGPGLPGPCGPLPFSFVIDPSNTSTLYAGCQGTNSNGGGGLFKSTDGGATWNAASSGLPAVQAFPNEPWPPNVRVNALAIDPVHARSPGVLGINAGTARDVVRGDRCECVVRRRIVSEHGWGGELERGELRPAGLSLHRRGGGGPAESEHTVRCGKHRSLPKHGWRGELDEGRQRVQRVEPGDRSAGFGKCLCAERSRHPEEHGRRRELERGVSRGDGERPVPVAGWVGGCGAGGRRSEHGLRGRQRARRFQEPGWRLDLDPGELRVVRDLDLLAGDRSPESAHGLHRG